MYPVLEQIQKIGIVPVVVLDDAKDAAPLAQALCEGGLPCAEVTFRTAAAEEAIRIMSEKFPQMLVGAGTVLTTAQVDEAVAAGAKFIVSPGLNPKVVRYCLDKEIPILPGCATPSDMEQAIELGLSVVKFFPAEANGGLKSIKAMSAPYTQLRFMPTGGVNEQNLGDYLAFPKIIACGGSFMVNDALIQAGDFAAITELTRKAVSIVMGFELAHVGVNANSSSEALAIANLLGTMFSFPVKEGNSSVFAGPVEVMKEPYRAANGHVAIRVNDLSRAMAISPARALHSTLTP